MKLWPFNLFHMQRRFKEVSKFAVEQDLKNAQEALLESMKANGTYMPDKIWPRYELSVDRKYVVDDLSAKPEQKTAKKVANASTVTPIHASQR